MRLTSRPRLLVLAISICLTISTLAPDYATTAQSPAEVASRTNESREFAVAFDKYVHDDSIVGAAYVLVKDGRAREWLQSGWLIAR